MLKAYHDLKIRQTDHRSFGEKARLPKIVSWTVDVDELKKKLMVEDVQSYKHFGLFRTKVLEPAQKEINEFTEINVFFEPIHKGRKVVQVKFGIVSKDTIERFSSEAKADEILGLTEK